MIKQSQLDDALKQVKNLNEEIYQAFHKYASKNIPVKQFKNDFKSETGQPILLENDFVQVSTLTTEEIANVDNVIAYTWIRFVDSEEYKALVNFNV